MSCRPNDTNHREDQSQLLTDGHVGDSKNNQIVQYSYITVHAGQNDARVSIGGFVTALADVHPTMLTRAKLRRL